MNPNYFVIYTENQDCATIVESQNRERLSEMGFCKKENIISKFKTLEEAQEFITHELYIEPGSVKYWE